MKDLQNPPGLTERAREAAGQQWRRGRKGEELHPVCLLQGGWDVRDIADAEGDGV